MFAASDIKNIDFSTARRGYNTDEVEAFLDKIEADYYQYEGVINGYKAKIIELEEQITALKSAQDSIQNVLLSAQKLADQIVKEAREKSEEIVLKAEANINAITMQEKELASAFEAKANERKAALQKELDDMVAKAEIKAKSINAVTDDAVARQQILFDRLKVEISDFKTAITAKYKEHLNILQSIPDTVGMDPQALADALAANIDAKPLESFIMPPVITEPAAEKEENEAEASSGFNIEELAEEINE